MLTAEGCRRRREQLWQRLDPKPQGDYLLLADPIHLMYLANFWIDPFSLGSDFGPFLLLRKDGRSTLIYDKRSPKSVDQAHVDEPKVVNWYDGQSPGRGPRQLALLDTVLSLVPTPAGPLRVHDRPGDPSGAWSRLPAPRWSRSELPRRYASQFASLAATLAPPIVRERCLAWLDSETNSSLVPRRAAAF